MHTTSVTLLDRLRQPDQPEAWNRFARLYTPLFLTWAQALGFHEADAADLAQNVLLKVMQRLAEYRRGPSGTFRGWLFTVAKHECADFRRRRATRPLPDANGLSDVAEEDSEMSAADYRARLVHRALELIRPDFAPATWDAFRGLMLDNRSAADVAASLGVSANAVYLARHRVLTRLREELGELFD